MDKIVLFNSGTSKTNLIGNVNPIMVLDNYTLDTKIKKNIDSNHMLSLVLDVDLLGDLVNNIPRNGVIKTYAQNEYQYWIIAELDKTLDTVEITCRSWVTEISRSMFIIDSKPRNLNSLAMLDWIKSNTEEYKSSKQYAKDLEVEGNVATLVSTNIWHDNFYNTIADLQEQYNCEVKKSGFKIGLVDYVGSKTSKYSVTYGTNLINTNAEEYLSVVRGVLPKGFDKLYGDIVYSDKLTANPNMLGEIIEKDYNIRLREEDKEDEEGYVYYDTEQECKLELKRLANLEFSVNKIDEPILTFDTTFLELSTVEEHKNDTKTWLDIGDKVTTIIPKFNIDVATRIIEMEIDVLADEITNITLSNNDIKNIKPPTLNSVIKEVGKLPTINDVFELAKESSLNTILGGFGANIYYTPNLIAIMDTDDYRTAKNCIVANSNGWFFSKGGINPTLSETTMIADINGNFNASVITTGILNADLIKAGVLKSFNNKSWINMSDGTFNFGDKFKYDGTNFTLQIADKDLESSTTINQINTNIGTLTNIANGKAKVFTSIPTVPYSIGDLWVQGTTGDLMRCKVARTTGSYLASEWEKASKYTDDTKANAIEVNVTTLGTNVTNLGTNVGALDTKVNTKAKVFISTPTIPYQVGDLWVQGTSGEIMRCKTARTSGSYTASEWEKASKYTDDTVANGVSTTVTALTQRVSTAETSINTANNNINLKASKEDITTAITSIEIGGRNLVRMENIQNYETVSFVKDKYTVTTQVNSQYGGIELYNLRDVMELNKQYIYQCRFRKLEGTLTNLSFYNSEQFEIKEFLVDGIKRSTSANGDMGIDNNLWHTFTLIFTRVTDAEGDGSGDTNGITIQPNRSHTTSVELEVNNFKLEKGTKATDWQPSVEDVNKDMDNTANNIKIGGRNLVLNSKENYLETTTNKTIPFELSDDFISLVKGQPVTISAYIEGKCATDDNCYYGVDVCIHFTDDTEYWIGLNTGSFEEVINEDGSKSIIGQRYSVPDVVPDKEISRLSYVELFIRNAETLINFTIKDVKIEIGKVATAWTPAIEDIDSSINDVYDYITTVSSEQVEQYQSSLELTANSITSNVSEIYATKTDTTSEIERLSTTLTESANDFNFKIASEREYAEKVEGELQSFKDTVETNINFDANGISISATNSPFASKFTTTKLSFTQDDNEVAYISNNKMYNTDIEVKNSLVIGSVGFLPRQNGNLSIVWKEG